MTPEQLLQPRFKVIANYPKSIHKVGAIYNVSGNSKDLLYCDGEGPRMRDYPHLFKKMEWWEERLITEMPDYVKLVSEHKYVFKIFSYIEDGKIRVHNNNGGKSIVRLSEFLPATKEEYDLYKAQQST